MTDYNNFEYSIVFEEENHRSCAYDQSKQIGECEFSEADNIWFISHTGVRPEYEGKGIARKLVEKVIEEARKRQKRIVPICSYAKHMMTGKEEYKDVL